MILNDPSNKLVSSFCRLRAIKNWFGRLCAGGGGKMSQYRHTESTLLITFDNLTFASEVWVAICVVYVIEWDNVIEITVHF